MGLFSRTAFSVAAWNVEHFGAEFKGRPKRQADRVCEFIWKHRADIICLMEVRSVEVFMPLFSELRGYNFHATDGDQNQEMLVAVRSDMDCFVTERRDMKAGNQHLRPGFLVTPRVGGEFYPIMFLHLKSARTPDGYGLRQAMLRRALKYNEFAVDYLRRAGVNKEAHYMFAGDLNTMGLSGAGRKGNISGLEEVQDLAKLAQQNGMELVKKDSEFTFRNPGGALIADLDHVVRRDHIRFNKVPRRRGSPRDAEVECIGWPDLPLDLRKDKWIEDYSDHAMLRWEVQRV